MNNDNTNLEIWKDVKGYESFYQVSDKGHIRSVDRILSDGRKYKGKLLKLRIDKKGYLDVMLHKEGKAMRYKVHRLVAIAFIDNRYSYPQVNHKDENKQNNEVSNLEWCDNSYNQTYGSMKQKRIEQGMRTGTAIYVIDNNGHKKKYHSIKEASSELNVFRSGIYNCLKGKSKTYKGYKFKLV